MNWKCCLQYLLQLLRQAFIFPLTPSLSRLNFHWEAKALCNASAGICLFHLNWADSSMLRVFHLSVSKTPLMWCLSSCFCPTTSPSSIVVRLFQISLWGHYATTCICLSTWTSSSEVGVFHLLPLLRSRSPKHHWCLFLLLPLWLSVPQALSVRCQYTLYVPGVV